MSNRDRAWRRAQFERIRHRAYKRELKSNPWYYTTKPHEYFVYNLDHPLDFWEFLKLSPEHLKACNHQPYNSKRHIWVEGKGMANPPEPEYDSYYNFSYTPSAPFYEDWQIEEEAMRTATKLADTPKPCSNVCCGNPRRHYKGKNNVRLTLQEKKAPDINDDWGEEGA